MKLPTKKSPVRLYQGDCLHMMRKLPDECVTAVVTDPPAGIGFMGREWDDFRRSKNEADAGRETVMGRLSRSAPQIGRGGLRSMEAFVEFMRERMAEALRVTVPGGLAIVWAHPKTSDWTSIALRLAGWERVGWTLHLFASGMPKGFLSKRLAEAAGVSPERAKQLMTTFRVPSVEPWLVFRKPSKTSQTANLRDHGTGYFPIGDYRVPRERIVATQGRQGGGTSALFDSGQHLKRYDNEGKGSLPKDVELVCSPECGDEHVKGCPTREVAARGRKGKNGGPDVVNFSAREASAARAGGERRSGTNRLTAYGDKGDSSRYFHRHGQDVAEEALAILAPKAKAQLRISDEDATAKHLRDGWRLFLTRGGPSGELVEIARVFTEDERLGLFNAQVGHRVRIRSTNERHRWCEHLFWRLDKSSPVGWRRVTYGEWLELPKGQRGHGNVHPTVKAQALVRPLVATATGNVDDPLVLDPFGGSGAVAQACLALGCRVVTAEQDPIVGWPIVTAKMAGAAQEFRAKK